MSSPHASSAEEILSKLKNVIRRCDQTSPTTAAAVKFETIRLVEGILNRHVKDPEERRQLAAASIGGSGVFPGPEQQEDDESDDSDDEELEGMEMDRNCDQIRRMINTFIDNGGMKVTEFQRKMNVSSKSYYSFMKQHGAFKGAGCDLYDKAWVFFKKREMRGIPMPQKKKTLSAAAKASSAQKPGRAALQDTTANSRAKGNARTKVPGSETAGVDLSHVSLPGEQADAVAVLDTCGEIRKKISAHLKKDGVTAAAFLRDISAQFHTCDKKISATQLTTFRGQSGPVSGNGSAVFYGAFCFFEKMRIAQGKPKSKHRLGMEDAYGKDGMDTSRPLGSVWVSATETPVMDQYGRITFQGR